MARSYDGDVKRGDMPKVAPKSLLIVPSDNSRWDWQGKTLEEILANPPRGVEEKLASFVQVGQIQPIAVHPIAGNKLKVHAGFTRAVAALLGVLRGVLSPDFRLDAVVHDLNEKEAFRESVVENHERSETTAVDDAEAVRRLGRYGYTDDEICSMYGSPEKPRSHAWLTELRRILQLPDEQKLAIHTGQIAAAAGIRLAKIADPLVRDAVLEDAKEEAGPGPVTDTHVLKAARKHDALDKPIHRRITELREFWDKRRLPGNTPRVRRISDFVLRYMNGEIDERAIDEELKRL